MKNILFGLSLLAVTCVGVPAGGQVEPETSPPKPAVYIAAYRTPRHMKYSKPEVFHQTVAGVVEYLESNRVRIAEDPVRKRIETSDFIPVATLANIAREAGASSLLVLTVDRPVTKWVKIGLEAYDLSGTLLWKESVDEGGGLSGKGGVKKALDKLKKRLDSRLGQPGLERSAAPEVPAAPVPTRQ